MRSELSVSSRPPGEDSQRSGKQPPSRHIEASNESRKGRKRGEKRKHAHKGFLATTGHYQEAFAVRIHRSPQSEYATRVSAGIHNGFHVRKYAAVRKDASTKNYHLRFSFLSLALSFCVRHFLFTAKTFRFAFLVEQDNIIQQEQN